MQWRIQPTPTPLPPLPLKGALNWTPWGILTLLSSIILCLDLNNLLATPLGALDCVQ